jgi:hypothetical protein
MTTLHRHFFVILVWLLSFDVGAVHAQELAHADPTLAEADEERPQRRRHTALLIAGASTFVTSYLVTAIVGAALSVVDASDCEAGNIVESCHDGSLMLVPLAGPFFTSRTFDEQLGLAGPQIVGAILAVAGIFHYTSGPVHVRERAGLVVDPVPLPAGGMLRATLTF